MKLVVSFLFLLVFLLVPTSLDSVIRPRLLIFPDLHQIKQIMRHHGTLWLQLGDDGHLTFRRNGEIIRVKMP